MSSAISILGWTAILVAVWSQVVVLWADELVEIKVLSHL
jgi:hypothetical protein